MIKNIEELECPRCAAKKHLFISVNPERIICKNCFKSFPRKRVEDYNAERIQRCKFSE